MPDQEIKKSGIPTFNKLFSSIWNWFRELADLKEGQDRKGAIFAIKSGIRIRGANAWMLICSILIASLGLDLNSPAIIIGAMLISPLMNPILGIGFAVATNDREILFISIRNFSVSILIALLTSAVYFWITPLGAITDEIRARTTPTVLDGLVAVFGGLAGIISITRTDQTNAIPGVAIATALMPPLCVTGFGFAKGNFEILSNSFYLFFLNSFFISVTTYLIIRLLKFPYKKPQTDRGESRRTRFIVAVFSLLVTIPGLLILQRVIKDIQYKQNIKAFVDEQLKKSCLEYKTFPVSSDTTVLVAQMMGRNIPEDSISYFNQLLHQQYSLPNTVFRPIPDYGVEVGRLDRIQYELESLGSLSEQLNKLIDTQKKLAEERGLFLRYQDSLKKDTLPIWQITREVKSVFVQLSNLTYAKARQSDGEDPTNSIPLFMVKWDEKKSMKQQQSDESRLKKFLLIRTKLDTLVLISY